VRDELGQARARWAARLGAFRGLGEAAARTGGDTRVLVEARFERGSAFLSAAFGPGGRLFAFECLDEAPFRGLPPIELFPLTDTEFHAYDDRSGLGMGVRFELDQGGRPEALVLGDPLLTLARE
jgi:hypothetical protein